MNWVIYLVKTNVPIYTHVNMLFVFKRILTFKLDYF